MSAHPGPKGGYEERDVVFRPIVVAALVLLAIILATMVLMRRLDLGLVAGVTSRSAPENPLAKIYGRETPPAPRLQADPRRDLAELRAREQALLDGYAWVDRAQGRVRIPVARAMELLLAEGKR